MIPRSKKGKLYVMIICAINIVLLASAYMLVKKYYDSNEQQVGERIGDKQALVVQAVREGERIGPFVHQAVIAAEPVATSTFVCGEGYIGGRKLIGRGTCDDTVEAAFLRALGSKLAAYPEASLANIQWDVRKSTITQSTGPETLLALEGTKSIAIGTSTLAPSPSGLFTVWPTEDREIVTLFGDHAKGALRSHQGLDVSPNAGVDKVGKPVYSIADGTALFVPSQSGKDDIVRVTAGDIIIEYVHVRPQIPLDQAVPVHEGDLIALSGRDDVHLQVRLLGVGEASVAAWEAAGHVTDVQQASKEKPYAVVRDGMVYLDPACFFDRTLIRDILIQQGSFTQDYYETCDAYETAFQLDERFRSYGFTRQQPTAVTASAAITPVDADRRVQLTYDNLAKQGLFVDITAAAAAEGIDPLYILAIITQESGGDAKAISWTGAAGIAQFTGATARTYFDEKDQPLILSCCRSGSLPNQCKDPALNLCVESGPSMDPRFDPHKSIRAAAKYIKANSKRYEGYQNGVLFALAAYNAGGGTIDDAIERAQEATGRSEPSWLEVKQAIMQSPRLSPERKDEITSYGDQVMKWYKAWGGKQLVDAVSLDNLGTYDLYLSENARVKRSQDLAVTDIHNAVKQCTDISCVDQAAINVPGVTVQRETFLAAPRCMDLEEQAVASIANEIEACKRAPDMDCACIATSSATIPQDMELFVTANELYALTAAGKRVYGPGTGYTLNGDSAGATELYSYDDLMSYASGSPSESGSYAELHFKSGEPHTIDIAPGLFSSSDEFVAYLKTPAGIAFTKDPSIRHCIAPPNPRAYCISDGSVSTPFYIDMALGTAPTDVPSLRVYEDAASGTNALLKHIVVSSSRPYTYLVATTTEQSGAVTTTAIPVFDSSQLTAQQVLDDANQGSFKALRSPDIQYGFLFEFYVVRAGGDALEIRFVDEFANQGPPLPVGAAYQPATPAPATP